MKIKFHRNAEKYLESLPQKQRERVLKAIYKLPKGDVVMLQGKKGEYRLRIGSWRVVWMYQDFGILVMEIDVRGSIYK